MIDKYLKDNNIPNLGCVAIINEKPCLFIITDKEIMKGIPIEDKDGIYDGMNYNDIALVGVIVMDEHEQFDVEYINEDNRIMLTYGIIILYIYSLKTLGLTIDDIINLQLLEFLIEHIINEFNESITI